MSEGGYARLGEDTSSVKDVVDAREGISLPLDQDDDEDISSEASTLLSSGVPSHPNHQLHHKHQRQQYHQDAENEETSPSRTGVLARIFGGEVILRIGLFAGMVVVVCLAVVRSMEGEFSPGLVAGGGLMMIMCLVVGKRDLWRGGMAIG
ncbi:hypothetical protein TGAM01_v205252 [Trichoderma gamsii]|uniref:Uncharacterized protein n=1 Tax=Trichoderma gamsii TaxID=398673 RepID=A0A2P4ZNE1_9HYPO|nr:hypothetical protein TGAM01_v205252 [Trichoderma gamsii]PON25815.1 hypothetical protein TGAM01_v205252 [Trichoderma gamsii]